METHAAAIADRHYQMIMDIPHIKEIFNTYSEYERYTTLITKYYKQLTKPALNEEYIQYCHKEKQSYCRSKGKCKENRTTIGFYPGKITAAANDLISATNLGVVLNRSQHEESATGESPPWHFDYIFMTPPVLAEVTSLE